ncbi:MAG TPA: RuvA C-terminal domain-containing protein [Kofleriaceae bacterium]|nr:RuvA C-terminal domain-containing protein [Kofleriaceae bacterium]
MPAYTLEHLSNERLVGELVALVAADWRTTAALLAHLGEVDARELFLPAACPTMHAYCTRVLRMSDDCAYKRMRAARAVRRFPQIGAAIADGRLHVSGVVVLAAHYTEENVDGLIDEATHRSKTEIEIIAARLAPRPDLPEVLMPVAQPEVGASSDLAPGPTLAPGPIPEGLPARVKPLAPERFALQVTISQATKDKLDRARDLLSHCNPSGDLGEVIDRALDALLRKIEKEKFGMRSNPRMPKGPVNGEASDPAHVSSHVRREVHDRDEESCAFVSEDGVRCGDRRFLEYDHREPHCRGGQPTVTGMGLYCRPHNQYEAERQLGVDFMEAKRAEAIAERAAAAAAKAAEEVRRTLDADVERALCGMGFKKAQASDALKAIADATATTIEERLRAALVVLSRTRGSRSSEGAFDVAWGGTGALVRYAAIEIGPGAEGPNRALR